MKKIFIGCSSYDTIDELYKKEAALVAEICAKKGYDLVFGTRITGSMGELYKTYRKHNDRKITAICMSKYIDDVKSLDKDVEVKITNTTLEQIEEFIKCDKIIYLAGGYGTITELMYLINDKVNKVHDKDILIVNINHFYDKILEQFNKCYEEKFTNDKDCYIVINKIEDLDKYL